jgi:hypothetical protein
MARYFSGSIGGVALQDAAGRPCRVLVDGAGALLSGYAGANVIAADGSVYTQIIASGMRARAFTIRLEYCPVALLSQIMGVINTALANNQTVNINLTDQVSTINASVVPALPDWLSYEQESGGIVRNVQMRLIATS